ncbi:MAG: hypothetical protein A2X86_14885 [Bdellovibrionales bacterium GWA2_49_15]|nr:MAG: hypothetical protein A2X86_14885 [Bdellovibrionales bacterium GWA2_49_15]HAZ13374.1 hypothetical protein [Bdellovibrionales bacterium]
MMLPFIQINLAVLLMGTAGAVGKHTGASTLILVWSRCGFAALGLLGLLGVKGSLDGMLKGLRSAWVMGVLLAAHWISFFASIQFSSVTIAVFTFSLCPILVGLIEPMILRSPKRTRHILFALTSSIGVWMLLPKEPASGQMLSGVLAGLLSALLFSAYMIVGKAKSNAALPVARFLMFQNLCAALLLTPAVLSMGNLPKQTGVWVELLLLGIGLTAIPQLLLFRALQYFSASTVSVLFSLESVYGVLAAHLLLGESATPATLAGGALIALSATSASIGDRMPVMK